MLRFELKQEWFKRQLRNQLCLDINKLMFTYVYIYYISYMFTYYKERKCEEKYI